MCSNLLILLCNIYCIILGDLARAREILKKAIADIEKGGLTEENLIKVLAMYILTYVSRLFYIYVYLYKL